MIYYEYINGKSVHNDWIEWFHHFYVDLSFLPEEIAKIIEEAFIIILEAFGHCRPCIKLNACYFYKNKMPKKIDDGIGLLHTNCHCLALPKSKPIPRISAFANMDVRKFTEYIFKDEKKSKGKKSMFESWGYYIKDSDKLKSEFEKQALNNYINGLYEIGKLDGNGQRISIPINLKGAIFNSGWMVEAKGHIRNITPFGGWLK